MMRSTRGVALAGLAAVALCGALVACSDSNLTSGTSSKAQRLRDSLLVSGPLGQSATASVKGASPNRGLGSMSTAGVTQFVYISLPPGSINGGDSARISSGADSGGTASALMSNGGFDPVPVVAPPSDSVQVAVFAGGGEIGPVRAFVPLSRPPSVVRTSPAKGRTDVAMNQMITIVFSQPINVATVTPTSIHLTQNGTAVAESLVVQTAQPWVVHLVPTSPLAPATTYTIAISTTITDINGKALTAPVTSDFTTATTQDSVASIAVLAYERLVYPPVGFAIAVPGGKASFVAYKVSASGDTLTPATSDPIAWSSDSTSVATVDSLGTVTAIAPGTATISACSGSICGHGSITVNSPESGITPTRVGDLGGGFSRIYAMKGGNAVGYSKMPPNNGVVCTHAFLWTQARGMEDLGTLTSTDCHLIAWMVNANGTVLGTGDSGWWIWRRATGMRPITNPDTVHAWNPGGINSSEEIAFADDSGSLIGLWSPTGTHITPAPAPYVSVNGLNDLGQVGLSTLTQDSTGAWTQPGTVAYVWDAHAGRIVATLAPGNSATGQPLSIWINSINGSGVVAGSVSAGDEMTAFRWTPSCGFTYLPKQGPGVTSEAWPLNEAGDAAVYLRSYQHYGQDSLFELRSIVWTAAGDIIKLGTLGGPFTAANGINDAQQVAGHSQVGSSSGPLEAVIWNLTSITASRAPSASASSRPPRAAASHSRAPARQGRTVAPQQILRRP